MNTPPRERIADWVAASLGARPVAEIFHVRHLSDVSGLRLADGRKVVVKVRAGVERAARCVAAQLALHDDGFACPRPLTSVEDIHGLAIHAESFVHGGAALEGTSPAVVDRFAELLADLAERLAHLRPTPPRPGPLWLAWDHPGAGVWPEDVVEPERMVDARALPAWLTELAARVRTRLVSVKLEDVVGHGDWETQNIRWRADAVHVVHDWDSLTSRPEAALVGAAAATFASDETQPTLAPISASERFLDTYERARARAFTDEEREAAWATGVWLAAYNARIEVIEGRPPLILEALAREGADRLVRAGA